MQSGQRTGASSKRGYLFIYKKKKKKERKRSERAGVVAAAAAAAPSGEFTLRLQLCLFLCLAAGEMNNSVGKTGTWQ